jgi:amicyanin
MKDNKGLLAGLAAVAVIIIGGVIVMAGGNKDSSTSMNDGMTSQSTTKDSTTDSSASDAVASNTVTIENYSFMAPTIKVKVGDTVTWTNKDGVKHNISPDSPSADFSKGELFGHDETYSFTFKKAGTYKYHCDPHPYMKGTVVVTE